MRDSRNSRSVIEYNMAAKQVLLISLTCWLAALGAPQLPETVFVSQWTTTTTYSVFYTYEICASLISAKEPCPTTKHTKPTKKSTDPPSDKTIVPLEPVFVAYDDDLHDYLIDYFNPSAVVKVESTAVAESGSSPDRIVSIESSAVEDNLVDVYMARPYVLQNIDKVAREALGMAYTVTRTSMLTKWITSVLKVPTTTKTFLLQSCIPTRFHFSTCS